MIEAGRWHLARGHPLRGLAVLAATVPVLFGLASDRPAITVDGLWIAEPPPGANVAAGYGAIVNHGAHNDRLVSVSAEISHTSEFHGMTMREDGVVEMRPFDDGLEIPSPRSPCPRAGRHPHHVHGPQGTPCRRRPDRCHPRVRQGRFHGGRLSGDEEIVCRH